MIDRLVALAIRAALALVGTVAIRVCQDCNAYIGHEQWPMTRDPLNADRRPLPVVVTHGICDTCLIDVHSDKPEEAA